MCRRRRSLLLVALLLLLMATRADAANDPGFSLQWHLHVIGAETAWPTGTGLGLTIGIVDTGVDLDHPDLKDKILPGRNFVTEGSPARDDNGHGTHVAGIAAAMTNNARGVSGVAADAAILPVKVLGSDGAGTSDNVAAGIKWAADNGAAVINVSVGVERTSQSEQPLPLVPISDDKIVEAIRHAAGKGVITVLAAGNDPEKVSAYEDIDALVVGATDKEDRLAPYSSPLRKAKGGLVAPGGSGATEEARASENVLSTYWSSATSSAYAWAAGTSMAAPHVAGAAAILRGLGLNPQQTVDRILSTAKDLGDPGRDNTFGYGRLDLAKAVEGMTPVATKSATGAPPSTPTTQLRTTPTTKPKPTAKTTTSTTTTTTTEGLRAGGPVPDEAPLMGVDVLQDDEFEVDETAGPPAPSDTGDDGLPVWPPLVATLLLAATTTRLLRIRRV